MSACDCNELDKRIFRCMDCAACTNCNDEYYMVHDSVWLMANPKDRGMLCIGCLEARLGRLLTKHDFTNCPLNLEKEFVFEAFQQGSRRLYNRLTNIEIVV